MRSTPRLLAILATLLAATTLAAHADTFTYSYYQDAQNYFTLTTSTLVKSTTTFKSNIACSAGGYNQCTGVYVDLLNDAIGWTGFFPPQPFGPGYFASVAIPAADFLAPGTYNVSGHTFSITDTPSSVTPEPSSLILAGTGILAMVGAARRRRHGV